MLSLISRLIDEESGQGMVEYSLIFSLVIIGVIVFVKILGENTLTLYENAISKMPTG